MDWNAITVTVLAVFGVLSLFVTLLTQLVNQLPDLIKAVRRALSALKPGDDDTA
ncbi:hypothetical protein ACWEQ7_36535 [Streptomyces sp. NPDC004069]